MDLWEINLGGRSSSELKLFSFTDGSRANSPLTKHSTNNPRCPRPACCEHNRQHRPGHVFSKSAAPDKSCHSRPACVDHNHSHLPPCVLAKPAAPDNHPVGPPACREPNHQPHTTTILAKRSAPDEPCHPRPVCIELDPQPLPGRIPKHAANELLTNSSPFQGFCSQSPWLIDPYNCFIQNVICRLVLVSIRLFFVLH